MENILLIFEYIVGCDLIFSVDDIFIFKITDVSCMSVTACACPDIFLCLCTKCIANSSVIISWFAMQASELALQHVIQPPNTNACLGMYYNHLYYFLL